MGAKKPYREPKRPQRRGPKDRTPAEQAKICTKHLERISKAVESASNATVKAVEQIRNLAIAAIGISTVALLITVIHMVLDRAD